MFVDHFVDLGHETDGFGEGDDDFVVMGDVVFGKGAALAVFKPFLTHLVAADVEVPYFFGHAAEPGDLRLVDPNGVLRVSYFFDFVISAADEFGARFVEVW